MGDHIHIDLVMETWVFVVGLEGDHVVCIYMYIVQLWTALMSCWS